MIDDNKSAVPRPVNIDNLTAIDDTPSEDRTAVVSLTCVVGCLLTSPGPCWNRELHLPHNQLS